MLNYITKNYFTFSLFRGTFEYFLPSYSLLSSFHYRLSLPCLTPHLLTYSAAHSQPNFYENISVHPRKKPRPIRNCPVYANLQSVRSHKARCQPHRKWAAVNKMYCLIWVFNLSQPSIRLPSAFLPLVCTYEQKNKQWLFIRAGITPTLIKIHTVFGKRVDKLVLAQVSGSCSESSAAPAN